MTSNPKPEPFARVNFAAAQNLTPEFVARLRKLGLEIVIVVFNTALNSPVGFHPRVEEGLGLELEASRLGMFDSNFYQAKSRWSFFHVPKDTLGQAMNLLKSQLDVRGLLDVSTLLHAEEWDQLRIWCCSVASANAALVEG